MIGIGLLGAAAGTMALDVYTYADMLAQARPSSTVPSTVVQRLAGGIGLTPLATGDEKATNRRSGAGALMGYGVALGSVSDTRCCGRTSGTGCPGRSRG